MSAIGSKGGHLSEILTHVCRTDQTSQDFVDVVGHNLRIRVGPVGFGEVEDKPVGYLTQTLIAVPASLLGVSASLSDQFRRQRIGSLDDIASEAGGILSERGLKLSVPALNPVNLAAQPANNLAVELGKTIRSLRAILPPTHETIALEAGKNDRMSTLR